jgi:hypothetical protein
MTDIGSIERMSLDNLPCAPALINETRRRLIACYLNDCPAAMTTIPRPC